MVAFIKRIAEEFLSTLPVRGATRVLLGEKKQRLISIHAPREGSDADVNSLTQTDQIISIHAPREGSDGPGGRRPRKFLISIHAPREGSDLLMGKTRDDRAISIHAPREGSDRPLAGGRLILKDFYPRSP